MSKKKRRTFSAAEGAALLKRYKGKYIDEIDDLTEPEKDALLFYRVQARYANMNTMDFLFNPFQRPLTPNECYEG